MVFSAFCVSVLQLPRRWKKPSCGKAAMIQSTLMTTLRYQRLWIDACRQHNRCLARVRECGRCKLSSERTRVAFAFAFAFARLRLR